MAAVNLVFELAPTSAPPAHLVFGDVEIIEASLSATLPGPTLAAHIVAPNDATLIAALPGLSFTAHLVAPNDATLNITLPALSVAIEGIALSGLVYEGELAMNLPALTFAAHGVDPNDATMVCPLPGMTVAIEVDFDSNVARPLVCQVASKSQTALRVPSGTTDKTQKPVRTIGGAAVRHQIAQRLHSGAAVRHQTALRIQNGLGIRHQEGVGVQTSISARHQVMLRHARIFTRGRTQGGLPVHQSVVGRHQDRLRHARPSLTTGHQTGLPRPVGVTTAHQIAVPMHTGFRVRHQEAIKPPAGRESTPIPPQPEPCYTPNPHLLFSNAPGNSNLLFFCENHDTPGGDTIVVPIRKVYIVVNDVYLKRVAGNLMLPCKSLSLSLDADSWTWSFSATLPASQLDAVMPEAPGEPVELEAKINGDTYRLLAEQIGRTRTFPKAEITIRGRGKSAMLADPYAPVMSFGNPNDALTAQQLMAEVLEFNGVPLGWDVDWNLTDWLVPAGAFSHQGTHMSALSAIAGAAGAYIQPHPTDQTLIVLPRYPDAPWAWGSVTPDFELPAAVTVNEGIEWIDKPLYNMVFVSGQGQGPLVGVKRAGSAGDLVAPGVVDPLITHVDAGRQRGISILGDTGRRADVSLSLPVLPETGVIPPGQYIEYADGTTTYFGITRSVRVDVTWPKVRQSITVETRG